MDKHEGIVRLKELALELGRIPSRREFERERNGRTILESFGGYTQMCHAAGLIPGRPQKITNEIFNRDIDAHLDEYHLRAPTVVARDKPWPKIAILGDMHEPFAVPEIKKAFIEFVRKHQPDHVVQIGDAYDAFSHAKFPRSHNVFTPKQEEALGRRNLEEFWSGVRSAAPDAKLTQIVGNHDVRALKRVLEVLPSIEHWAQKYFEEIMSFDGVNTIFDPREEFVIDDIVFIHGYRSQLGSHRDFMLSNVVTGHSHQLGAVFRNIKGKPTWELNAGYCADPAAKGLSYTSQKSVTWTQGWAYIDEYGPRAIPWFK